MWNPKLLLPWQLTMATRIGLCGNANEVVKFRDLENPLFDARLLAISYEPCYS